MTVSFDSYNNGGGEAPAIDVKLGGVTVGHLLTTVSLGMRFVDVLIDLHTDRTIDVTYDGQSIFSALATGYAPMANGQFAFGARTGGFNDNHWIDNLTITTSVERRDGTVPEPATLALVGIGMAGLGYRRRQLKSSGRQA